MQKPEVERLRFVEEACGGDGNLVESVQRLLRAHRASESFLQTSVGHAARVGRYIIRGELGRGSMGLVYDAVDPLIGRSVAIKVIHLKSAGFEDQRDFLRDRLFREANSAGRLFHPGIVVILDVGQDGDLAFIAMERVEGLSLDRLLASRGRLSTTEALLILRQTAAALDYAHERGVVHRDIKPANIMVAGDLSVKVADFGIAKIVSSQQATVTGLVIGTPSYMSPEQIEARSVDGRSDQFSLVVLAYELLTGSKPFEADTMATLAHLIVYGKRPRAHCENPVLPEGIDDIFERGLHRSPELRFCSCAEFVAALERALQSEAAENKNRSVKPRTRQDARTRGSRAVVLFLILVISFTALGAFFFAGDFKAYFQRNAPSPFRRPISREPVAAKVIAAPAAPPVAAPEIKQFALAPSSIVVGQQAVLSWEVINAKDVHIDPAVGPVASTGSQLVNVSSTTKYVLTASGAGGTTRATAPLEVKPKLLSPAIRAKQLYSAAVEKRKQGHSAEAMSLFRQAAELG